MSELLPCPFCGGTDTQILERGKTWGELRHRPRHRRNSMSKVQQNVVTVLTRMLARASADKYEAECFSDGLEDMLNDMAQEDCFGSEGQNDPRGDARDGTWSVLGVVQGDRP